MNQDRACFKKNSSPHIWPKNFRTTFFRDCTPKSTIFYPSKILMTIFLVITSFYDFLALHMSYLNPKFSQHKLLHDLFCIFAFFYDFLSFRMFCTLPVCTPYMHTRMLFSRFCTLLCALVTVHTAYAIYFVLIHHCTNSLSSLHIFVYHCTFCASLHTKTSPEPRARKESKCKGVG